MSRHQRLLAATLVALVTAAPSAVFAAEGRVIILESDGDRDASTASANALAWDVRPTVKTSDRSPYGTDEQTETERLACVLLPFRIIVPFCDITMEWRVMSGTGGHVHNSGRPPGRIDTENGATAGSIGPGVVSQPRPTLVDNSGRDGILEIDYVAPEAAGTTRVRFRGVATINGERINFRPNEFRIRVGLGEFVQLPPNSERFGTGVNNDGHGSNDGHVRSSVRSKLESAYDEFEQALGSAGNEVDAPQLFVTSANLPRGGLFDLNGDWQPPHVGHRFGLDVDIDPMENMSAAQRRELARRLKREGFVFPVDSEAPRSDRPSHWHARFSG